MGKKGPPAVWTKGKIEEAFAGFVEKNSRLPVAREMNPQFGLDEQEQIGPKLEM